MSRKNLAKAIELDRAAIPCYGSVQNRKERYSTVTFNLETTEFLENSGEARRVYEGKDRFFHYDPNDGEYVIDGRYDFWAEISDRIPGRVEVILRYIATSYDDDQSEKARFIRLTHMEQVNILKQLNDQCQSLYEKSAEEMLLEARKQFFHI